MARFYGWFGPNARKYCPHEVLIGIYGDEINRMGGFRLQCVDCNRLLAGPIQLAEKRKPTDRIREP